MKIEEEEKEHIKLSNNIFCTTIELFRFCTKQKKTNNKKIKKEQQQQNAGVEEI